MSMPTGTIPENYNSVQRVQMFEEDIETVSLSNKTILLPNSHRFESFPSLSPSSSSSPSPLNNRDVESFDDTVKSLETETDQKSFERKVNWLKVAAGVAVTVVGLGLIGFGIFLAVSGAYVFGPILSFVGLLIAIAGGALIYKGATAKVEVSKSDDDFKGSPGDSQELKNTAETSIE